MKTKKIIFCIIFLTFLLLGPDACKVIANPLKETFISATEAYSSGDYETAIKLYEKCLEIYPDFAQVYYYLGLANKEKGTDAKDVIALFKKAIEKKPDYAEAYDNLAKIYYETGAFDEALESGLKAVEIKPNFIKAHLTLGWIYLLGQSQPDKAATHFEVAVKGNKIPYGYFGLGLAYFMDQERIKVLEVITALRQMDQEDLAVKLEAMVRDNVYITPEQLNPLLRSKKNEQPKGFFEDEDELFRDDNLSFEDTGEMEVRIKGENIPEPTQNEVPSMLPLTGAQRIEELRKRGASF